MAKALLKVYKKKGGDSIHFAGAVSDYLQKRGLSYLAPAMLRHLAYAEEQEDIKKTLHVEVGHEIDEESLGIVASMLKAEPKKAKTNINSNLVGGFIARLGHKEIDASMRTYLNELRTKLLKG